MQSVSVLETCGGDFSGVGAESKQVPKFSSDEWFLRIGEVKGKAYEQHSKL